MERLRRGRLVRDHDAPATLHWIAREDSRAIGDGDAVDAPRAVRQDVPTPRVQLFPREVAVHQVLADQRGRFLRARERPPDGRSRAKRPRRSAGGAESRDVRAVQPGYHVREDVFGQASQLRLAQCVALVRGALVRALAPPLLLPHHPQERRPHGDGDPAWSPHRVSPVTRRAPFPG